MVTDVKTRYYEGGISSVYFWDLDDGFAGVVLLKKSKFFELWSTSSSNPHSNTKESGRIGCMGFYPRL